MVNPGASYQYGFRAEYDGLTVGKTYQVTEKNMWGLRSRCNQCISSNTDYSKRCLGCTGSYTGGRSEKSVDNYKFCYSYWKRFAERGESNE